MSWELILSVYILTFLIGLPTNLLSLCAFSIKIHRKATPTDILLLNLTVSDLLFLLVLPLKMHEAASHMRWHLPYFLCSVTSFLFFSTIYTSSLLLMAVSVDRYLGVAFPIRYKLLRKPLYAVAGSAAIWIVSSAHLCFIYIVDQQRTGSPAHICYDNFSPKQMAIVLPMRLEISIVLCFIPLLVCAFCYLNLILILSKLSNFGREKKLRATGMAAGTLLVFVVCFLPFNVTHIVGFLHKESDQWRSYTLLLSSINSVLDPITFYFSSSAFQVNMKNILTRGVRSSSMTALVTLQRNATGTEARQGQTNPALQ
ncbi:free fatty acid receptor 3-like [Megalops cyprinoides]|uniref:free fatty acid receptor 3-like n=1 Tax=Megalops cyprinoides TaxID=118141 RepID=UPI0018645B31|nr:free fatty acid receptor 3-like [Megalops cyprinoides]